MALDPSRADRPTSASLPTRSHAVNPWVALAYLVAGVCFILALARAVFAVDQPARQPLRHGRHADRGGHDAGDLADARMVASLRSTIARAPNLAHRSARDRACHRPPHPDDRDAAAGRRVPLAGRPGGGAGRGGGLPQSRGVRHPRSRRQHPRRVSRVEMALGAAIGAITFSGSVIAFAKLNGNMSGAPILLPGRHVINLGTLVAIIALTASMRFGDAGPGEGVDVLDARRAGVRDRVPADHPDRRGRHAGRGLDAQFLFGLGGGGDGLHAAQHRDDHHRRAGRQLGRDPQLHHVPGDEPQLHHA